MTIIHETIYEVTRGSLSRLVKKDSRYRYPRDYLNEESLGRIIDEAGLEHWQQVEIVVRIVDADG